MQDLKIPVICCDFATHAGIAAKTFAEDQVLIKKNQKITEVVLECRMCKN